MNFRTQVELPEKEIEIRHSERIVLFGSCFAENIGNLLIENKFQCDVNPFGVLYNPISIAVALQQILLKKNYNEDDLFKSGGLWHSWMHHSSFSSPLSDETLTLINTRLVKARKEVAEADWLIVTFGTAYVYMNMDTQQVVGNCHKMPEQIFSRSMLKVSTIVEKWQSILKKLRQDNPKLKVLFTVSPIRHVKDGMHGNQLSKSILLLAIDEICQTCPDCHYFPSYEIMMDELRDYRFYADDMLHPSLLAVKYLWTCFSRCYFTKNTLEIMARWEKLKKALSHKPFQPDSEEYKTFLSQIVLKII